MHAVRVHFDPTEMGNQVHKTCDPFLTEKLFSIELEKMAETNVDSVENVDGEKVGFYY